jgi:hypothetical protein
VRHIISIAGRAAHTARETSEEHEEGTLCMRGQEVRDDELRAVVRAREA